MSDDPFADLPDADRTVVMRPRPGGVAPAGAAPGGARAAGPELRGLGDALPLVGINPLAQAAAPILAAVVRLRGRLEHPDPDGLRRHMAEAVRGFEERALATGLDSRSLRAARYALCATVDDVVLSTPWGSHSNWTRQSLTSLFHNEVSGGERFFDILAQLERELGRHAEVVELMYLCLSLGFEGRYRVATRGATGLVEVRDALFRTLRGRRGEPERELSPHWEGLRGAGQRLRGAVPPWVMAVAALALVGLLYVVFNFLLAARSDVAGATLAALPPRAPAAIPRAARQPPPPLPPAPVPVAAAGGLTRLRQFLAPEIREGLVEVFEDAQAITVRINNRTMFASGEATVNPSYQPLLARIGAALQDEPGRVLVAGYTDNQPIRTARFPSNWQLSAARAQVVAAAISAKLSDPARVRAEGRGDADPIAPNTTPEGRSRNRRTDIILVKPPAPP